MPRPLLAALLAVAFCSPAQQTSDLVIRVSVDLVQVDAVVKDSRGRTVSDLKAEDFEILQDGKPQAITNCAYVNLQPPLPPAAAPAIRGAAPPPPTPLRRDQVRRTIALVVDDIGLSFEGTARIRNALKQFVDKQVQPGDLVAIIRSAAGVNALQQFTYDKRLLHAAVDQVRYVLAPGLNQRYFMLGTLGALRYVVAGLSQMPGRKSIVLFSETMRVRDRKRYIDTELLESLRRTTDAANRASAVIYAVDPRGLLPYTLEAADNVSNMQPEDVAAMLEDRREHHIDSQEGMAYLAHETGGQFLSRNNDLNQALGVVLDDQAGYYLIGYHPEAGTFDPVTGRRKFHKISVRVKRPGLSIRSRHGFYGVAQGQEPRPAQPANAMGRMMEALASPFAGGDVPLKLTSLFYNDIRSGSFVRSMLHIDGNALRFEKDTDGWHKGAVDILMVSFGEHGQAVDRTSRTYTIRVRDEALPLARRNGFLYSINHVVKKPGAYHLRVAVRDTTSDRLGCANQFIEVPDLRKGWLTISGVLLGPVPAPGEWKEGQVDAPGALGSPALRIFRPGSDLAYAYQVLNARLDNQRKPRLEAQLRLFRDGTEIYTGKPASPTMLSESDPQRLLTGGSLQLSKGLRPGDYVLQVVVTDKLSNKKQKTASQWIDFQVAAK